MRSVAKANEAFLFSTSPEQQRAAALNWLMCVVTQHEGDGSREHVGRYLVKALRDLDRGYTPPILHADYEAEGRGRTRGGRANARARAVVATEIIEEFGASSSKAGANRLAAFRSGMTEKAIKRLRENIAGGRELEVASLKDAERQAWQSQLDALGSGHENLLYLALTEIGYDRAFHKR